MLAFAKDGGNMENILKANLAVLKDVSEMISDETGCSIIICDQNGEIIEATQKERVGKSHIGAIRITSGETDEVIITKELEEEYKATGTDTRLGYNYVISILDKRVGSLGISGEPEYLKPIVRIAAKTLGFYISEYLKEKEKNKILQKMATVAGKIMQQPYEKIDYQTFADDLLLISGAKYVFFDIYNSQKETSTIVAVAGKNIDIRKIIDLMGFQILGCERENRIIHKLKNNGITAFDNIAEFPCNLVPGDRCADFQTCLGIGQICSLEIAHEGLIVGDFILFMPRGEKIQNTILVELYAAQVGQLLMRAQAESALKKSEAELKEALGILDSFWKHSPNPISIIDHLGKIIRVSESVAELFGSPSEELEGSNLAEIFPCKGIRELVGRFRKEKGSKEPLCYSDEAVLTNGESRYYDIWIFPIANDEERNDLLGMIALDVTDRKQNEEKLKYLSNHDSLTGLYNRTFFEKEIQRISVSEEYPITIISLDVDGLKIVNDTMGHAKGDQLLINLAHVLGESLRDADILTRVGGDEFVIILPKSDDTIAQLIATRIGDNIDQYNQNNPEIPISVSLGLCTIERPDLSLQDVLKKADEHMYHNKFFQKDNSRKSTKHS